jgi:hypothetical protein
MLPPRTITLALATTLALPVSTGAGATRCRVPESMRSGFPGVGRVTTKNVGCDVGRDIARGIILRYHAGRPISANLGEPQPTFTVRAVRAQWRGRYACRGRYAEVSSDGDLAYELRCSQRTRVVKVLLLS